MALFGLFGHHDRAPKPPSEADKARSNLYKLFQQQVETTLGQKPTDTAFFNTGQGKLNDLLKRRQRADAGAAAARGLSGGEFEIAQGANRGQIAAGGLRDLLSGSEQMLTGQREGALQRLLAAQGLLDSNQQFNQGLAAEERMRRREAILGALSNIGGSIPAIFAGG